MPYFCSHYCANDRTTPSVLSTFSDWICCRLLLWEWRHRHSAMMNVTHTLDNQANKHGLEETELGLWVLSIFKKNFLFYWFSFISQCSWFLLKWSDVILVLEFSKSPSALEAADESEDCAFLARNRLSSFSHLVSFRYFNDHSLWSSTKSG